MSTYLNRFNAFENIFIDKSVIREYVRTFTPVASLNPDSQIEFYIPAAHLAFIDLTKCRIKTKLTIYKIDGKTPMDSTCLVAPVANTLFSAFRSAEVLINDVRIGGNSNQNWGYKAYVDVLLEKNKEFIETMGLCQGTAPDTPHFMDETDVTKSKNIGLRKRYLFMKDSGSVELSGFLPFDLCKVDKFLPPKVNLRFKFFPANSTYFLMTGETKAYTFAITEATLYISYIIPSDTMYTRYMKAIQSRPAVFKIRESNLRAYVCAKGNTAVHIDNILTENSPDTVLIFMVKNTGYTGEYKSNPYNLANFKLNFCSLFYEGELINGLSYTSRFEDDKDRDNPKYDHNFTDLYSNLYLQQGTFTDGNLIPPEAWRAGFLIIRFDIPESIKNRPSETFTPQGISRLNLTFTEELSDPLSIIVYTQTQTMFGIDKNSEVITNVATLLKRLGGHVKNSG